MPAPLRALIGFVGGAVAGVLSAFAFTYLWGEVLGLSYGSGRGKPALDFLLKSGLVLIPAGAIGGAIWLARPGRGPVPVVLMALLALALAAMVWLTMT